MGWQTTPFTLLFVLSGLISFGVGVSLLSSRDQRPALLLMGAMVGAVFWCWANAFRLASTTLSAKLLWHNVRFVGPTLATLAIFLLAAEFTNRRHWLHGARLWILVVIEVAINLVVWTNGTHRLVRTSESLNTSGAYVTMDITFGPLFFAHALFQYVLLVVTLYWLVSEYRQARKSSSEIYQIQTGLFVVAVMVPLGLNVLFVTDLVSVDPTPIGFVVYGLLFATALYRYRLLDIMPIARGTVVENMDNGVLVLDDDNQVIDINPRAEAIIDVPEEQLVGVPFEGVFSDFPTILETFQDGRDTRNRVSITRDGQEYHYEVKISPIYDSLQEYVGRTIIFDDITHQVEREQKLQRQNERLDQFASVVSHDLRNPLGIAETYLDFAEDTCEKEDFQAVREALDRMDTMIDDLLTMARAETVVDDPEEITLKSLATEAWETAQTDGASVEIALPDETTIYGDPDLLRNVFENLFRNAVDHNEPAVTVTVGMGEDGFYIADDGTGIPEAERDDVFDQGYTTDENGTGLGLAIVGGLIKAHGWEIEVDESDSGGARFDITGVELTNRATTPP